MISLMKTQAFDEIDRQIIAALSQDGRLSARQISFQLPVSEGTCRLRLERLLSSTVSARALINPGKVGFTITAFMGFKVEPTKMASIVERLGSYERMTYVNPVTGMFDIITLAMFKSARDLSQVMREFTAQIEGVKDIQTSIYLDTELGYYTPVSMKCLQEQGDWPILLDETDLRIVGCLSENGRLSSRNLAKVLSIGEVTVRKRLKHLLSDKIITIRGMVDPESIGFPVVATIGLKVELPKAQDIASSLASNLQICFVATCTGIFDIVATGLFRSTNDLYRILGGVVYPLDGVKETHTFVSLGGVKGKSTLFIPRVVPEP